MNTFCCFVLRIGSHIIVSSVALDIFGDWIAQIPCQHIERFSNFNVNKVEYEIERVTSLQGLFCDAVLFIVILSLISLLGEYMFFFLFHTLS